MTRNDIKAALAALALILSATVGKTAECQKTTTFETDSNGNIIIKIHYVCER